MSNTAPDAQAARILQRETSAPYMTCLNAVRSHRQKAEAMKHKEPTRPFADCLAAAARPFVHKEAP